MMVCGGKNLPGGKNLIVYGGKNLPNLPDVCMAVPWLLFENRPALYFFNYKEKKNNIRMLDTLFIEDFIDVMEEYFQF